jgi:putative tricarboxylic transport membrane protein
MRINDTALGLVTIAIAIGVIAYSLTLPRFAGEAYGAMVFPAIAAVIAAGCGVLLIWHAATSGSPEIGEVSNLFSERRAGINLSITVAAIVLYLFVFEAFGFILSTIALLAVLFALLRVRFAISVPVSVGLTLVIALTFDKVLRVPLPWGVLEAFRW